MYKIIDITHFEKGIYIFIKLKNKNIMFIMMFIIVDYSTSYFIVWIVTNILFHFKFVYYNN